MNRPIEEIAEVVATQPMNLEKEFIERLSQVEARSFSQKKDKILY